MNLLGSGGRIACYALLHSQVLGINSCALVRYAEPTTVASKLSSRRHKAAPRKTGSRTIMKMILEPVAPEVGFEPTTWGLTVPRSTAELLRNNIEGQPSGFPSPPSRQSHFWPGKLGYYLSLKNR